MRASIGVLPVTRQAVCRPAGHQPVGAGRIPRGDGPTNRRAFHPSADAPSLDRDGCLGRSVESVPAGAGNPEFRSILLRAYPRECGGVVPNRENPIQFAGYRTGTKESMQKPVARQEEDSAEPRKQQKIYPRGYGGVPSRAMPRFQHLGLSPWVRGRRHQRH